MLMPAAMQTDEIAVLSHENSSLRERVCQQLSVGNANKPGLSHSKHVNAAMPKGISYRIRDVLIELEAYFRHAETA